MALENMPLFGFVTRQFGDAHEASPIRIEQRLIGHLGGVRIRERLVAVVQTRLQIVISLHDLL